MDNINPTEDINQTTSITPSNRTEEVQTIIDRMPTYWVKWVVICIVSFMGAVLLFSFLIKYPDTVDGQISVTAATAPVRLVANSSGRIDLLKSNKVYLKKGDVIANIESGANYKHILLLDSVLNALIAANGDFCQLPDTLILGDINSVYNAFRLSYLQYERLLTSDIYDNILQNMRQQIVSDEAVIVNISDELKLKQEMLRNSNTQLSKDSVLLSIKGISEQEYQRQYTTHLSLKQSLLNSQSTQLMKQSEVSRSKMDIQRMILEETENREKVYYDFITQRNLLTNTINLWKYRYLQYTPIDGELEYLGFWRNNSFIQSGQELFSIIPDRNDIMGEVMIPSYGSGKVEVGQSANVKIDNFPYREYGILKGVVKSVSRITNKMQTADGIDDAYLVVIYFPDGTVTNFGKLLPIDFETKGIVEIITRRKRLIERLFDNLKTTGDN